MKNSQEVNQPNNNQSSSENASQRISFSIQNNQRFFCFLKNKEKPADPQSFFSENGLSQDIIQVIDGQPDICLEVFYALYHVLWPQIQKQSNVSLKDAWKNFLGGSVFKGVLCPPEKLIGKKKPKDIKKILSENQGEHQVFQDFDVVLGSILTLKQKIMNYPGQLLQKEEILASLGLVEEFYQGYRDQVKAFVQALLGASSVSEYDTLIDAFGDFLEPKAVMMSDIFPNHWAYRIPRTKAQKVLSLDENRRPTRNNSDGPSNHRVASLPEGTQPLVYFKANGGPAIQPEKEFMLYRLYRYLQIPVPETALLILTDVFVESPDYYYAVQASEAVIGESVLGTCNNQDQEAYVSQMIGALLTNPSDGSFKNFQYCPSYKTLIGIDNDEVFRAEFIGDDNKTVSVKSILYLLPQIDLAIPESTKILFTTLDPNLMVFLWLKDLSEKNKEYRMLFEKLSFQKIRCIYQGLLPQSEIPSLEGCLQQKILVDPELNNGSFCPVILISKDLLNNITEKLQIVEKTLLQNDPISPQTLFEEASPILGKYYRKLRLKFPDPKEALNAVWGIQKDGINYSKISSLLDDRELESFSHNKIISDENLAPETFLNEYKNKLASSGETSPLDKLIQRHSQRKRKRGNLFNLSQTLEELQLLIQEGFTDSQSLQEIVEFWYSISKISESDHHLQTEVMSLLSDLPSAELKWLFTIEKYFKRIENNVSEAMGSSPLILTGALMQQRIFDLTESEKQFIFDQEGYLQKNPSLTGRSNVTCFPKNNAEFYLKQNPEWPGYEFASILFMRHLGITHLPYQELLIHKNPQYPTLLTQKVAGDPVFQVWGNPKRFKNLDPFHTGLQIIAAILLNPEDGKEDNYILSPDGRFLIPIDHDHCFLPSTFQKGTFWNLLVNSALQTKTLLFCLDEMNKPIPNKVKQHILDMNFDLFLQSWLQELIKVEERFNSLIGPEQRDIFLEKGTVLRIPFYEQFIHDLYWKVNKIQDLLRSPSEQTPMSLLKAVEPFAARCYGDSFQQGNTLQSRFKVATSQLYENLKTETEGSRMSIIDTQSMMKIINISKTDLQDDAAYKKMGPSGTLET